MKNKNQKKLKNKKYRWGAYRRTTVGVRGYTHSFSIFYSVSAKPKMLKYSCFSENIRKSLYFCNRKRNRKVFEVFEKHCRLNLQLRVKLSYALRIIPIQKDMQDATCYRNFRNATTFVKVTPTFTLYIFIAKGYALKR